MVEFRFCPLCGSSLDRAERGGRMRPVCPGCGFIHYRNPTVGVAVILRDDAGRILLGRRSPDSSYPGQWCIPCGHVEWDEDVRAAAIREFAEETGLTVRLGEVAAVHSNFHNPGQHTVGIWFFAQSATGTPTAGDDLDSVGFFPGGAPPEPLAFPTDRLVLTKLADQLPYNARRTLVPNPSEDRR